MKRSILFALVLTTASFADAGAAIVPGVAVVGR
jgi:hypothetical protein